MKSRLMNGMIASALLVMFVLLAFQGAATAQVAASGAGRTFVASSGTVAGAGCAFAGDPVTSMRSVYDATRGRWVTRTAHGAAGVDGGVLELRSCRTTAR